MKKQFVLIGIVAVAALTSGCSRLGYFEQARDSVVYTSVPQMRMAQTLNPEASKNRKVVAGLDSQVARNIHETYAKSFVKAEAEQQRAGSIFLGLQGVAND